MCLLLITSKCHFDAKDFSSLTQLNCCCIKCHFFSISVELTRVIFRQYTQTADTLLLVYFTYIVSTAVLINMKLEFMNEYNHGYHHKQIVLLYCSSTKSTSILLAWGISNILAFTCFVAVYHLLWPGGICVNQIMPLSAPVLHLLDFAPYDHFQSSLT